LQGTEPSDIPIEQPNLIVYQIKPTAPVASRISEGASFGARGRAGTDWRQLLVRSHHRSMPTLSAPAAEAFRERIREADVLFVAAVVRLLAPIRRRIDAHKPPRPELLQAARRTWINDIPSFGSLDGPHPELGRNRLTIRETRAVLASFQLPEWKEPAGPPAVALVSAELIAGAKGFRFYSTLFVLIDLAAIAAWFAISGAEDPAPLLADLSALATAAAALDTPGPTTVDGWEGEVVPVEPSGPLAFRVSSYVPA
jgi:hypothetical protein